MAKKPKNLKNPDEYEVGYRKPPSAYKFKKGAPSPNPIGCRGKEGSDALDVIGILETPMKVRKKDKKQRMEPFEISTRRLVKKALENKNVDAALEFVKLCETYGVLKPPPAPLAKGNLVVPKDWDWDEWLAMFHLHGPPPWSGPRSGLTKEDEEKEGWQNE
jgi:hypothetical protein